MFVGLRYINKIDIRITYVVDKKAMLSRLFDVLGIIDKFINLKRRVYLLSDFEYKSVELK